MSLIQRIGNITFEIDESYGTAAQREKLYKILQFSTITDAAKWFDVQPSDHALGNNTVKIRIDDSWAEPASVMVFEAGITVPTNPTTSLLYNDYDGDAKIQAAIIVLNPSLIDSSRYYSPVTGQWHEETVPDVLFNEFGNLAAALNPNLDIPGGNGAHPNTIYGLPFGSSPTDTANFWENQSGPAETFSASTQDVMLSIQNRPPRQTEYNPLIGGSTYDTTGGERGGG
jgi:hypothetical protein